MCFLEVQQRINLKKVLFLLLMISSLAIANEESGSVDDNVSTNYYNAEAIISECNNRGSTEQIPVSSDDFYPIRSYYFDLLSKGLKVSLGMIDNQPVLDTVFLDKSDVTLLSPDTKTIGEGDNHGSAVLSIMAGGCPSRHSSGLLPGAKVYVGPDNKASMASFQMVSESLDKMPNSVPVINNSWSVGLDAYGANNMLNEFIDFYNNGRGGLGTVIVFAAGNKGINFDSEGCNWINCYEGFLTVGASKNGLQSGYSNYGSLVDVCYNSLVEVSYFDEDSNRSFFGSFSGTSYTAPIVSSVVALMAAINPSLTADQLISIVKETADVNVDGGCPMFNPRLALQTAYYLQHGTVLKEGLVPKFSNLRAGTWNMIGVNYYTRLDVLRSVVGDFDKVLIYDGDSDSWSTLSNDDEVVPPNSGAWINLK